MTNPPFWYFGGKRAIAPVVWRMLGDVPHYIEPFAGSLAVLLNRPKAHKYSLATVNDINGYIANIWRALQADPDAVARYACWPVLENDLHARHIWLLNKGAELTLRLEGDPDYYDAKIAGWYLWANASWIGTGFCAGEGRWNTDGVRRVDIRGDAGRGAPRQLPHLGNAGHGVRRQVDAARIDWLKSWFADIQACIENTRVACGEWGRIVTPTLLGVQTPTGVFLDPPYEMGGRHKGVYTHDAHDIAVDVARWAIEAAAPTVRIVYAGYAGGEVDALMQDAGWRVYAWKGWSGYQGQSKDNTNRHRERLWYSPACLEPFAPKPVMTSMFEEAI